MLLSPAAISLPRLYPLRTASPFVFNISPRRWGLHSRETRTLDSYSLCFVPFIFFLVFFFFFSFLLSLQFHLSISASRLHASLPISIIPYFYSLGHIRIIYIIFLTPLAFGLFRPRVSNESYSVFMCACVCVYYSRCLCTYNHS